MNKTISVRPVCPFIGDKECISDGITREILWHGGTAHPCVFWDGDSTYNGVNPEPPCRIQRAVDRILKAEKRDPKEIDTPIDVPWGCENKE